MQDFLLLYGIQTICQRLCRFVLRICRQDCLAAHHNGIPLHRYGILVLAVMISPGQVAHDQIGTLFRANILLGCRHYKFLAVYEDIAILGRDMFAAVCFQFLDVVVAASNMIRMV